MVRISKVRARQVLDSRAIPTVQSELTTSKGIFSAIVPSGGSAGQYEALELRDGGSAWNGKGVSKAVSNVNTLITKRVEGETFTSQSEFDDALIALDGTKNKSKLGANAVLSASMAFSRAIASEEGLELYESLGKTYGGKKFILPVPMVNVINGGKHAGKENDIQEQMFIPAGFKNFSDAIQACVESYHILKGLMKKKFGATGTHLADEGGFAPNLAFTERLEMMSRAVSDAGYSGKIKFGLDSAASEFYRNGKYIIESKSYSSPELLDFYSNLIETHPVISIEDGFSDDDWAGWKQMNAKLGGKIQIVGDDLLVTNVGRIKKAVEMKACNALLLKVNQVGTVTESMEAAKLAKKSGWNIIVSHRSGESEDQFIADLVVGLGAGQCKFGAPARSERAAKYNRLLKIEEAFSENGVAKFARPFD